MNSAERTPNLVELTPEFVRRYKDLQQELEKCRGASGPEKDQETQELRRENARLTDEVKRCKAALATKIAVEDQNQSEQKEIRELRSRLVKIEQDSGNLQKTLNIAKSKLKATEAELLEVRLERDTSLKEAQTLNTALKALQKRVSEAEGGRPIANPDGIKSPELKIKFLESEIIEKDEQLRKLMLDNALQAMQLSKLNG